MRSLNSDLKRSKREATDLMGVTKSLREDSDRSTGLLPKSGPEQLSMQSSMVSKLLALPENGNIFCFRTTQIGMIDKKNVPVQPPKMKSLQMPSLLSK